MGWGIGLGPPARVAALPESSRPPRHDANPEVDASFPDTINDVIRLPGCSRPTSGRVPDRSQGRRGRRVWKDGHKRGRASGHPSRRALLQRP